MKMIKFIRLRLGSEKGRLLRTLLLCAVLLLSIGMTAALADRPSPRSIKLNINEISVDIAQGSSFTLEATVSPQGASENYKWWVSDSDVLSVEAGQVTCLKPGTATVYVSVHGFSDVRDSCLVTVTDSRAPERIIVYPSAISAEPGTNIPLSCVVMPQTAGAEFKFSSSNNNVATVSEEGVVSVFSPGHATITVRSAYTGDVRSEIKLTSEYGERIQRIVLSDTSLTLEKGQRYALGAAVEPSNASRALVYTSADEEIAAVDENGVITALKYGATDITVSSYRDPSVSVGIPLSVTDALRPESIRWGLSGETLMQPGQTLTVSVHLEPATADTAYTLSSSRPDIVSLSGDALTALKPGISYIRIQSGYREDLFEEFKITVDDGSGALVMPLRRTGADGIDENLASIDRIKGFALAGLRELYDSGKIRSDEFNRRTEAVENAFAMYAFPWTVDEPVKYWKSENSENGAKDFKPGTIYYGLPYTSGENHNRAYNVSRALEQERYFPVEGQKYYVMNPNNENYASGYAGNDCSAFVAQALWGYTVYGDDIVKTGTLYYDSRLRAFDDPDALKAGDLLVKHSAHVVMFLYWVDAQHTQAVIIQQGGSEPAINTVNTSVQEISDYTENSYRLRRLAEY
ncbi:MAG: Ig-like domain-containing protein [Clostridia bacterium]|nr:Ig-like domain-containing protein [Clostridia bacterium]